jgi:hypothetical protein
MKRHQGNTIIIFLLAIIAIILAFYVGWKKMATVKSSAVSTSTTTTAALTSTTTPSGDEVILQAGFPTDVPLYTGATPISSNKTPDGVYTLSLETTDPLDKISAFYKEKLPQSDWILTKNQTIAGVEMIDAKKDKRQISVQIIPREEGKMAIAIVVSP